MPPELFVSYEITHQLEPFQAKDIPFSYLYDIGAFMVELDDLIESLSEMLQSFLLELRESMVSKPCDENKTLMIQLWEDEDWVYFFPEDENFAQASIKITSPLLIDENHRTAILDYIRKALNQKLTESPIEMSLVLDYIDSHVG